MQVEAWINGEDLTVNGTLTKPFPSQHGNDSMFRDYNDLRWKRYRWDAVPTYNKVRCVGEVLYTAYSVLIHSDVRPGKREGAVAHVLLLHYRHG